MEYFNFTHSFHQYQTYPTNPSLHQYQSYPINPFLTSHTNPSFPSFPFETLASYSTDISFITPSQNLYYTHGYTPHLQPSCTSATTPNTHPNSTHIKHTFQQQTTNSLDSHSPFSQHITYHSHKATTTPQIKDLQDFLSETYEDDKMSIPIFDGKEDAYWWVLCAEKSFKDHRIPDTMKLQKAVTNLRGGAHQWWLWRSQHQPLLCWDTFTTVFLWHFKPEWRSILPIDEEEELALELQRSAELDDCLILSIEDEKEDLALELQRLMELDDCSILSIEDEKEERVLELHRLTENLIFPNSHYHELYSTFTPEMTTANSFSVLLKAPFNDIEFHGKVDFAIPPKPPDSKVTIKELPLPVKIRLPLRMLDFPGGKVEFTSEMRFISDTSNIRVHCYRILDDDGEFMNHTNPVQVNKKLAVRMHSEMVTFQGHHYQVTDIVSDDRDLVSSSSDCTLKWWRNDQCVQTWEAHKSTIQAVIKLPTRELVTGSSDTTLKIWKGKTCLHTFEEHSDTVPGLAGFSFDNSQIGRGRYELAAKVYEYVCGMMGPLGSTLFEELGLYYIGPVDGHNIEDLICVLQDVGSLDLMGPVLVHVITDEKQVGEHNKKSNNTDKQQDEYVSYDFFYNVNQKLFRGFATTAVVREGHIDILEILIKSRASQLTCKEALIEESCHGQEGFGELLMSSNLVRPHIFVHAVVTACCRGFTNVVTTLIKVGVDASATDRVLLESLKPSLHINVDYNALVAVVVHRQVHVVSLLLQNGAMTEFEVRLEAWSWDTSIGEELRVGAALRESYAITWFAVKYFKNSGAILSLHLQYVPSCANKFGLWNIVVSNLFTVLSFILGIRHFLGVFKFVPHLLFDSSVINCQTIILIAIRFVASLVTKMKFSICYSIEEFSTFPLNLSWRFIMCVFYHARLVQYCRNGFKEKCEGLYSSWFLLKVMQFSNSTFRDNIDTYLWKEMFLVAQVIKIKLSQFKRWDPGRKKW